MRALVVTLCAALLPALHASLVVVLHAVLVAVCMVAALYAELVAAFLQPWRPEQLPTYAKAIMVGQFSALAATAT